jgi:hypothetical protein
MAVLGLWLLLELWPLRKHATVVTVFRAQDTLYRMLEDCAAVTTPSLSAVAELFIQTHVPEGDTPRGSTPSVRSCTSRSNRGVVAAPTLAKRYQYFVYDVPADFTTDLLDDTSVDVRRTPMAVLESRALGPEIAFHKFLLDEHTGAVHWARYAPPR